MNIRANTRAAHVRIIVADEHEAVFLDTDSAQGPLTAAGAMANEAARLQDQDLESDRPGRSASSAGGGRHAMDGERSAVRHQTEQFARAVARKVEEDRQRQEFDRLVILAAPRMLGLLRQELTASSRNLVAAEVAKDLVHEDDRSIRAAVPKAVFLH